MSARRVFCALLISITAAVIFPVVAASGTHRAGSVPGRPTTTLRITTTTARVTTTTRAPKPPAPWTLSVGLSGAQWPTTMSPYMSASESSSANRLWFQHLMYRPLYWFGNGVNPLLNSAMSLAADPVFNASDTTVTITLKPTALWSDGTALGPADVIFWLNLEAAYPSADANYVRPVGGVPRSLPDFISSVSVSGSSLTLTLNRPVNPTWFTANELSDITPLPAAWDVVPVGFSSSAPVYSSPTSDLQSVSTVSAGCHSTTWIGNANSGPGNGAAATHDVNGVPSVATTSNQLQAHLCTEVRDVLANVGRQRSRWADPSSLSGRLFSLVDGAWKLTSATSGAMTFVANAQYPAAMGAPHSLSVALCPTTSDCARWISAGTVDWALIDPSALSRPVTVTRLALSQPLAWARAGYQLSSFPAWGDNSIAINAQSASGANGQAGTLLRQTWFRRLLNASLSQATLISVGATGAAVASGGPVPLVLGNSFAVPPAPPAESVAAVRQQLLAHGFAHGVSVNAALSGVPVGTPLSFSLLVDSSDPRLMSVARSTLSPWAQVGIAVSLTSRTRSQIIDTLLHSPTLWDFALWHGGFAFSPNVYPSGENYLFSNAAFNVGHLSDGALDAAIAASLQPRGSLAQYDAVARAEAPEVWMPTSLSLCEARHLVTGPINPLEPFSPELWHR